MNTWTDEELETLLRETFASKEPLADPDAATRLGTTTAHRRRRWVLPAAAAAVVVIALGSWASIEYRRLDGQPAPLLLQRDPPKRPAPDTYAAHRAAARAEAARLLTLVALPGGAEYLDGQPAGGSLGDEGMGPSDPGLTQTAWWQVPASPAEVGTYLRAHEPDGFTSNDDVPGTSIDGRYSLTSSQTSSTDPAAYRPAFLLLRWKALDGGTVVRADVFIGAYDVRDPASVLADVTAVKLSRTVGPSTSLLDLTRADGAQLAKVVDSFQRLPASMKPPMVASCPAPQPGREVTETITFTESGGSSVVARLEPSCWGQVTVTRDGVPVGPTLDPGDLDAVVSDLLAAQGQAG